VHLQVIDWVIAAAALIICFAPALFVGRRAKQNTTEFFASPLRTVVAGRSLHGRHDVQQ
jgi:hypothetical protein